MKYDFVHDLLGASAALSAAADSGLLEAITHRSATVDEYAAALGLDARAAARVLDVLWGLGLAERSGARFEASEALRDLDRTYPGGLSHARMMAGHTNAFLRTGVPFLRMDAAPEARDVAYAAAVAFLGEFFSPAAEELAGKLEGSPERILDVGAGSGVWSLAMASLGDARVTGLDLPGVLPAFRARAEALGLGDRVDTVVGDFHSVTPPPATFDRVVLANVLHLERPLRAEALIARMASAVRPGGEIVLVDAFPRGTREADLPLAIYELGLAMRTAHGSVHARESLERWVGAAGFGATSFVPLAERPGTIGAIVVRAG